MTFYVDNETGEEFGFNEEELLGMLVKAVLASESVPFSDV